jgi:hypothetical protein
MKVLKNWRMFLEDGVAAANASTTSGMGPVSNAVVGTTPGVPAESGSGDNSSTISGNVKRKKGDPSEVSDLRDLEDSNLEVDKYSVNIKGGGSVG